MSLLVGVIQGSVRNGLLGGNTVKDSTPLCPDLGQPPSQASSQLILCDAEHLKLHFNEDTKV